MVIHLNVIFNQSLPAQTQTDSRSAPRGWSCNSRWRRGLTVHRVEFDTVGRGRPVRSPLDAELVMLHTKGLHIGDVKVNCEGGRVKLSFFLANQMQRNKTGQMWVLLVRTCGPLSNQWLAHPISVLGHHLYIILGSRLQVVKGVCSHIAHKDLYWLARGGI